MGTLIQTAKELENIRSKIGQQKLVLTNGCFDILHVGHIRYLQEARKLGDYLLIGINSDLSVKNLKGESRPVNTEYDRAEVLNALSCVDFTFIFSEATADNLILTTRPDLYVKGGDYNFEELPEKDSILQVNCEYRFVSFHEGFSTTNILSKCQ